VLVHAGDVAPAGHPAVKGREQMFEPVQPQPDKEYAPSE
jgi:hypothetical protein